MNKRFALGMVIYALVFLVIASAGLWLLWDFMEAYEQSRPVNTIKAYIDSLTPEDLSDGSGALLDSLDSKIQSREEASQLIQASATGSFSYAKKSAESTENRQVYVLRNGRQVIGQFAISAGEADKYGLRVWEVTESSFDFSHLLGEKVSVTVPSDFVVSLNGHQLDEGYIVEKDIRYTTLEEFYDDHQDLPVMVTYEADNFLGAYAMEVQDREGNPTQINDETNMDSLLPACTEEEKAEMEKLMSDFLIRYVAFTGSSTGSAGANYNKLKPYLVTDGALSQRLATAISGLYYAQSLRDTIQGVKVNQQANLGNDRYFHDTTYVVETVGKKGPVSVTYNLKVILLDTEEGLRVEAMTFY